MSEELQMNAYYFSFNETSEKSINEILSAVAVAGDMSHSTDDWMEEGYVEKIQQQANKAAQDITALRKELSEKERELKEIKLAHFKTMEIDNRVCAAMNNRSFSLEKSRDAWRSIAKILASETAYHSGCSNTHGLLLYFEALKASEATKEGKRE